jgi:hypothetical protein
MVRYDLCFAWDWEYDAGFAASFRAACSAHGVSMLEVTLLNVAETVQALAAGQVVFLVLFDRASDDDDRFLPLVDWAVIHGIRSINPRERAVRVWDKGALYEFLSTRVSTPYTIVIPPYDEQPDLPLIDMRPLGQTFTVKPAHGGGGEGVVLGANSLDQVQAARQQYPHDRYLLQAHIEPAMLGPHPAWFRVAYCLGRTYPCWWHPETHVYVVVTPEEMAYYGLEPLDGIAQSLVHACGLDLFSTEIALTEQGEFLLVDPINDPVDLRMQSSASDGMPDEIVTNIAERLATFVETHCAAVRARSGEAPTP